MLAAALTFNCRLDTLFPRSVQHFGQYDRRDVFHWHEAELDSTIAHPYHPVIGMGSNNHFEADLHSRKRY